MRRRFFAIGTPIVLASAATAYFFPYPTSLWFLVIVSVLFLMGCYDAIQQKHAIRRNYPLVGRLRYLLEAFSPELQQYFIESDINGRPFTRNERALAYQRAKNVQDTRAFGTQLDINTSTYEGIKHSIYAAVLLKEEPRVTIGGKDCKHPYSASILNVSAMSFGSLSANAIKALNLGAKKGNYYHNTGEGSVSPHHRMGGDLVWQIGTGYFGCREKDGNFNDEGFKERANYPEVKMIEIKISQGAKPGHGGVLPKQKNTEEIAKIRMVEPHTVVLSPPSHKAFNNAEGLLQFIKKLRELSGGKPVGFKICIGRTDEFTDICKAMKKTGILPDFITVDGAEGGTGAAPMEFSDGVGMPLEPALIFVHQSLIHFELRDQIKIIASGKIISGHTLLKVMALGADICNSARGFMFSIGCIQALRCNTNECPTGVATQNKMLMRGLVVTDKSERAYHFHKNTIHAAIELLAAAGCKTLDDLTIDIFMRGDEFETIANRYFPDVLTASPPSYH
ncbi:MAG: FMN-binding glutamate synthase family protein [Chitinophagaceae bacterium]|nr:FMN-binding glutamate synthase family protein [Chitinophagaceae bacterium]